MLRAESQGDGSPGPANSRCGAIPRPAICASRCSPAPIIRLRSSRSNCRPDKKWSLPASSYAHIRQSSGCGPANSLSSKPASGISLQRRLPRIRPALRSQFRQRNRRALLLCRRSRPELKHARNQDRSAESSPDAIAALSEILIEAVASGGSVSFMHPLPRRRREFLAGFAGVSRSGRANRSRRL